MGKELNKKIPAAKRSHSEVNLRMISSEMQLSMSCFLRSKIGEVESKRSVRAARRVVKQGKVGADFVWFVVSSFLVPFVLSVRKIYVLQSLRQRLLLII